MVTRQLNIRMKAEEFDYLDAAAFLEERSPQELVTPMIDRYLAELQRDESVKALVNERRVRRSQRIGQ